MSGRKIFQNISEKQLMLGGLLVLLLCFLPAILLGNHRYVLAGDQLDGEIFTYLFGAKYLFSGAETIPEYMGGVSRDALFPPAPMLILVYKIFPPSAAFLLCQMLVAVVAFLGMNGLLKKLISGKWVAGLVALVFALLPFYGVYGLTIAGIPMLLWAMWELRELGEKQQEQRENIGKRLSLWGLVAGYGLLSSFVLSGFYVVGFLWLYGMGLLVSKKRRQYWDSFVAITLLTVIYGWFNRSLVAQVLGIGAAAPSHKSEYILHGQPFFQTAWNMLLEGSGHAPSYHKWMLVPLLFTLFCGVILLQRLTERQKTQYKRLCGCFLAVVAIAVFYGAFHSEAICQMRQNLGGFFVYFQLDRIYWLYPVLWYVMLALLADFWWQFVPVDTFFAFEKKGLFLGKGLTLKEGLPLRKGLHGKRENLGMGLCVVVVVSLLGIAGLTVLWQSDFKKNVRLCINPATSQAMTWEKYYGTSVFANIRNALPGEPDSYRVACVGLNPAVAVYHGFYTVDGYSNNYDLSYKHAFRKVIAGELEKDSSIARYFDDWGNRAYLFSAELGTETYFEKDSGRSIQNLSIDSEALKELGCTYVFAGVPVENATELGWELEGIFEGDGRDCRYQIRVYKIS